MPITAPEYLATKRHLTRAEPALFHVVPTRRVLTIVTVPSAAEVGTDSARPRHLCRGLGLLLVGDREWSCSPNRGRGRHSDISPHGSASSQSARVPPIRAEHVWDPTTVYTRRTKPPLRIPPHIFANHVRPMRVPCGCSTDMRRARDPKPDGITRSSRRKPSTSMPPFVATHWDPENAGRPAILAWRVYAKSGAPPRALHQ